MNVTSQNHYLSYFTHFVFVLKYVSAYIYTYVSVHVNLCFNIRLWNISNAYSLSEFLINYLQEPDRYMLQCRAHMCDTKRVDRLYYHIIR